jgi:hypothetical protein
MEIKGKIWCRRWDSNPLPTLARRKLLVFKVPLQTPDTPKTPKT